MFKDALLFSAPTNLVNYLKQNQIVETKSVWPYTFFKSVAQLNRQTSFPPIDAFFSELKNTNISIDVYEEAKKEYETRLDLPVDHPLKMKNFKDWLVKYNLLDASPLAKAIDNSFSNFYEVFKIDPSTCLSLPKLAQLCVFKAYKSSEPLCYSFAKKMDKVRNIFRENIIGGLVNVFSRYTELRPDEPNVPHNARYAPNGEPFTKISFFDFNALYLWCQKQEFPTTPGILWELVPEKKYFRKKIMSYSNSIGAIQWLLYQQETCPDLIQSNGSRVKIEHQFFRGEHEFLDFKIDGYAKVDGKNIFFEYLGCFFHNCPKCNDCNKPDNWELKKRALKQNGKLHFIRECDWTREKKEMDYFETPDLPLIWKNFGSMRQILQGIEDGELFGFCLCDVKTPPKTFEDIHKVNFPPVIRRMKIDEEHISPYMKMRVSQGANLKLPVETVVQTFNGEQLLLFTPLIRFYMDLGLEISNITMFVQYRPGVILGDFVDQITEGRIKALEEKNSQLALTYKTVGNRY